jgi:hypothetical protein
MTRLVASVATVLRAVRAAPRKTAWRATAGLVEWAATVGTALPVPHPAQTAVRAVKVATRVRVAMAGALPLAQRALRATLGSPVRAARVAQGRLALTLTQRGHQVRPAVQAAQVVVAVQGLRAAQGVSTALIRPVAMVVRVALAHWAVMALKVPLARTRVMLGKPVAMAAPVGLAARAAWPVKV